MRQLCAVRVGPMRMTVEPATAGSGRRQLDLLPSTPAPPPAGLVQLDRRARGTEFLSVSVGSVLN